MPCYHYDKQKECDSNSKNEISIIIIIKLT